MPWYPVTDWQSEALAAMLTPCKKSYTVFLQLVIIVLDSLKQKVHARLEVQPSVDEVPADHKAKVSQQDVQLGQIQPFCVADWQELYFLVQKADLQKASRLAVIRCLAIASMAKHVLSVRVICP